MNSKLSFLFQILHHIFNINMFPSPAKQFLITLYAMCIINTFEHNWIGLTDVWEIHFPTTIIKQQRFHCLATHFLYGKFI